MRLIRGMCPPPNISGVSTGVRGDIGGVYPAGPGGINQLPCNPNHVLCMFCFLSLPLVSRVLVVSSSHLLIINLFNE